MQPPNHPENPFLQCLSKAQKDKNSKLNSQQGNCKKQFGDTISENKMPVNGAKKKRHKMIIECPKIA